MHQCLPTILQRIGSLHEMKSESQTGARETLGVFWRQTYTCLQQCLAVGEGEQSMSDFCWTVCMFAARILNGMDDTYMYLGLTVSGGIHMALRVSHGSHTILEITLKTHGEVLRFWEM